MRVPTVMAVAGTDPTGGAGLAADIKTIHALGGYALPVVSAVVAQNGWDMLGCVVTEPALLLAQMEAVAKVMAVDMVKIGLLGSAAAMRAMASWLQATGRPAVLDPVMAASAGHIFAGDEQQAVLRGPLAAAVTLITPNLAEAGRLLNTAQATSLAGMVAQAQALARVTPWVLLKGGHFPEQGVPHLETPDVLAGPGGVVQLYRGARINTPHGRGTGCTLSSAVALYCAQGCPMPVAVAKARHHVRASLRRAADLGLVAERGPLQPFA
ncbi:hydroxymethylpyrimidine/phosphomethylpyrimidine kinase [Formicincola oecophyllae]|uniref:hydroxymethylpyrimidine kinase n=1 Tax=Formicincola oecophyllae TaxID=2558361 RepID=A0A4Y6U8C3_9PROT|nr:hydroxymethylpyrimidine/phosphomethylpyrimidine kinase [Formicincola oecophyllae]QDH13689.1 hydroxymethylpyrimidine/phosphomethylpyrimidine kinase [Formicincola oecophyllae]